MAWDGTGFSDTYDTSSSMPGSAGTARATWTGIGIALALIAVIVTGIVAWLAHVESSATQAPLVAYSGPRSTPGGTGDPAGTGDSGSAGSGATGTGAGASSPVNRVDRTWAARGAAATGISDPAFLAYASADLTIEKDEPSCGLGWNTLAAIGTAESANGTYGGATLLPDGYTSKPIVGVPLDGGTFGGSTLAAIPAAGNGNGSGSGPGSGWERAEGPFQFLPSTWATWGTDGNGDGVASPNQIDDAAVSAARYLCASGAMTTPAGWRAAVFSYNHSDSYVNQVANLANRYAAETSGLS